MNRFQITAASIALMGLVGCQSQSDKITEPEQTNHASQGVYQVEYYAAQKFAQQSDLLSRQFEQYCAESVSLDATRQQWRSTMESWMALQGQERGPEAALAQSWNVQFWPDKKNTTGRKMSSLIRQDKAWSASEIAQQSVTVQGLGSLEWLLYDESSSLAPQSRVCQTAIAISQNLNNNANAIYAAWQTNPWKRLDDKAWTSEYIALLSNQLEYSMKKMSRPLAKFGQPRPYFTESWRSQTSMTQLKANVIALRELYLANGKGLDASLRQRGYSDLANRILRQFDMTIETWPVDVSLFDLLQSKDGYRVAYSNYNKLEQLKYLIHEEVAIELGVVIGFNATDGD
ncbi:iron-regulated protein A [Vibrio sinaloensis]|uniref:imelysin family protein n=1 Tax=Photobacterium sp. (strain ATCC 43367) TaxID=379097 RepID=UPI0005809B17|nr:imelysin family protein [Vibrio sinaloensis]KIE19667.1 iron-regulated protein A [Vibrio sinaloensis]